MRQKTGNDLSCSGRVRRFWPTSGIRRIILVTIPEATQSLPTTALVVYVSYFTSRPVQST
jgi:hypothetical protein